MITDDEKIRKAHEIYYKRNGIKYRSEEKTKGSGINKILAILIIVTLIVIYQNQTQILKSDWIKNIKNILNTKINFEEIFKTKEKDIKEVTNTQNAISQIKEEVAEKEEVQTYEIIWPYQGEITSSFGERESENPNINGNHTGIDIAGTYGEDIVSSINGKVTEISEEGNLGKHIKIENENYTTIYAHCSEILKKEGEEIKQGEVIAKIGSTGNSTGNHLHFEILKNGEYIDPITVIEK